MRIRSKFIVLFLALSLAPLALVGAISYRNGKDALENNLGVLFEARAARAIEALDKELLGLHASAQSWTELEVMSEVTNNDLDGRISSFLIDQTHRHPLITRAVVANLTGHVVAANRAEWVGEQVAVSSPVEGATSDACSDDPPTDGRPVSTLLTCSFPIHALFDEDLRIGSLVVSWNADRLFQQVQLDRSIERAQGDLVLLRRDGLVVSAPERLKEWLFHLNLASSGGRAARLAGSGGGGFVVETLGGRSYLVGYAHSQGASGWSALVIEEGSVAFAPVFHLRRLVLAVAVLVGLLSVLASVYVSRRATDPLLAIADVAGQVAAGRLDVRVESRSRDEIGTLARSFDTMVRELREQRDQLVDKQYLDSVIASMIDGLLVVDAHGLVQRANRAFVELLGQGEDQVLGRTAESLFADEADVRGRLLEVAHRQGAVRDVELSLLSPGPQPLPVSVSAGAIRSRDGVVEAVVCVVSDITRRKQAERALVEAREGAEAAARLKDEFIATVSHEIRTPLNGVIGMTDLLLGTPLSPRQRGFAQTARRSGDALLAVVNDILDFEKVSVGPLQLESLAFDLRTCLEGVVDIVGLRAQERGLEVTLSVDPGVPDRVVGDPSRLRQVLLNLGSNAVKFTPRGMVDIRVQADPGAPSQLIFSIVDTGIGIAAGDLDKLFKPFSQVDASTTRRHGGTGLGLAISKQLVERMGGRIGVESAPHQGSRFWFTVALPAAPERSEIGRPIKGDLGGLHVLIVDDNATNRQVVREMLLNWRCTYEEAGDAFEALEKLHSRESGKPFDLAIIDFQMPEVDGGQLGLEIKRDPALARIPLLLLTSAPRRGDAAEMWNLGFEAYLTKPIKASVLHDAISTVMEKSVAPGDGHPHLTLVTAHTLGEADRARARVLVVGDEGESPSSAVLELEGAGCRCDTATNEGEALRAVREAAYDLVLLDCHRQDMDGYSVARRIRQLEAEGTRVPIVALSEGVLGERERCLVAGMDDLIPSPRRPEDLLRVLERYLPAADR